MLEIKCPPVLRKFTKDLHIIGCKLIGSFKLETCDLEECDFLQVKLIEYSTENEAMMINI